MKFKSELLTTKEQKNMEYNSSYRGAYNTMQFVLRLRDDVRKILNEDEEITPEKYQAFSTYLHENIHWWQHIGSNFGFLFSTAYPSFATQSYENLQKLIKKNIKYKSLLEYEKKYFSEQNKCDISELNIIVNNFFDLEYAKQFGLDNKNISRMIKDRRFFLSVGHSYLILWSNVISLLSGMFDEENIFLPKIENWISNYENLKDQKVEGFFPDSTYHFSPLGIRAIYEGQAIFNQVLYLKIIFKENNLIFKDFIDNGMLYGVYIEAFDIFLQIIKEERPFFLDDELIPLFLLVCDISINPTNGFPIEIYDFENFIKKNDPGCRFITICNIISKKKDYFLTKCKQLTKETYIDLSKYINKKMGCKCSYSTIQNVLDWKKNETIAKLMEEENSHEYEDENMPFRLFLAKYIKFQEDKYENPHYFCWIGYHIPNAESTEVMDLFEKHKALFTDSEDGEIKATIISGVNQDNLFNTFNKFYQHTILYELILKWISEKGEFNLDYKWLLNQRNEDNLPQIKNSFKKHFGIELEEIQIL